MMHGRRRVAAKEPTQDEKDEARQQLERYCALNSRVMGLKAQNVFTTDALDATRQLLELNTELHTVWNYRRTIMKKLDAWEDTEKRQSMLEQELGFLMKVIRNNIKSYWMWNHRMWALSQLPQPTWRGELSLVDKLIGMDARNYHAWDYRRFVIARLKDTEDGDAVDEQEFAFTTAQINRDCANHSAWHNRSKLLPAILARADQPRREKVLQTENELIQNAIYTDPEDQNAWLYYDWLLDIQQSDEDRIKLLRGKIAAIRELLELEEDGTRPLIELVSRFAELGRLQPGSVSDAEKEECMKTLCTLKGVDSYHAGRYTDISSALSKRWKVHDLCV
ncbi:Rab geranylgeranyltransferase [Coemansia guatemalensis]|uniref:Geranylgeranyl transferase type-2 subunit alpha n=1 Tax=Coemansia guatemalensis TaxID=2761395 RepID=A0A9W8HZ38_9FUNG|nr:Rab geranylgeranyltransferase [Coemansia guatemalensis]